MCYFDYITQITTNVLIFGTFFGNVRCVFYFPHSLSLISFPIYSMLYFILRRREKQDKRTAQKEQADTAANKADNGETTHM